MTADYRTYLATNVLNEQRMVTYRSLSRALKIHGSRAKQILYDFHQRENAKKAGSVHATYLVTGVPRPVEKVVTNGHHVAYGEDQPMRSSPPISSSIPQEEDPAEEPIPVKSIILVREEDLEDVKSSLQEITSVHVYSLESGPIQDLHVLTDVSRDMRETYASEDPLEYNKGYGVIQNKNVQRRTGRRPPPVPSAPPPKEVKTAKKPEETSAPKTTSATSQQSSQDSVRNEKADKAPVPETKAGPKQPALKRDTSDIFKSFAKAKPKLKKEDTDSSAVVSANEEPVFKDDSGEGVEEDDDAMFLDTGTTSKKRTGGGPSRKEREAKLRKMMDEDDEEMPDAAESPTAAAAATESPTAAGRDTPDRTEDLDVTQVVPPKQTQHEALGTIPGGRRRGKRQVMKKKMIKDEEGYLVTKEEPVWESFSEDEPEPLKPKAKQSAPASSDSKPAKSGGKKGGNIMSFFSKK